MKQKANSKTGRKPKAIDNDRRLSVPAIGEQQRVLPDIACSKVSTTVEPPLSDSPTAHENVYTDAEKRNLLNFATISPSHNAAIVIEELQSNLIERRSGDVEFKADFNAISSHIGPVVDAINDERLEFLEEMLVSQSLALQAMFTSLTIRAKESDKLSNIQVYMTLALKAQSQSRSTIQALVDLKFPRQVSFVKQANFANGHQQVNNAPSADQRAHEKNLGSLLQTKLLESVDGQRMEHGATGATSGANSQLEAMATVNGAKNIGGQGQGQPERIQGRKTRKTARSR